MSVYGATMRILQPAAHIFAFYDGRIDGVRLYSEAPNWLDDGAYALGVASYAIVDGDEALVYDAHISLEHASLIRRFLQEQGVKSMRLVVSHHHDDHVAGNQVFADCEIISNELTLKALQERRTHYETATPPIKPLILPTRTFADRLDVTIGNIAVQLLLFDIHSHDETLLWLPESRTLLAGDALEDTATYVSEPTRLNAHLRDLDRLASLPIKRILPNHGAETVIANGGYSKSLIAATKRYTEKLLRCRTDAALASQDLRTFVADDIASGALNYFAPYEAVHRENIAAVLAA